MTAAVRSFAADPHNVRHSQAKHSEGSVEMSCHNFERGHLTKEQVEKRRVQAALWRAFPEANSENELCLMAVGYFFDENGRPVSKRTVKYWLRGETLPNCIHYRTLIGMVGVEFFFPSTDLRGAA